MNGKNVCRLMQKQIVCIYRHFSDQLICQSRIPVQSIGNQIIQYADSAADNIAAEHLMQILAESGSVTFSANISRYFTNPFLHSSVKSRVSVRAVQHPDGVGMLRIYLHNNFYGFKSVEICELR